MTASLASFSSGPNPPATPGLPFDRERAYQLYLDGLLTGDRLQCRESFEQWVAATSALRTIYEDLVQRSLYDVGERWERERISVATEHLATAISEGLLNLTIARLIVEARGGRLWVESVPGHGATFLFSLPTPSGEQS